jgi:hypothetical protein
MLLLCLFVGAIAASTEAADRSESADRQALVATLERMIATGEPHHSSHDQGELLQRAVNAALAQSDEEVALLATRAAALLSAQVARPVIAATETVPLAISSRLALNLPYPVDYKAEIVASVDGGETVRLGHIRFQSGYVRAGERVAVDRTAARRPPSAAAGARHV